jgi:hypothetical protein
VWPSLHPRAAQAKITKGAQASNVSDFIEAVDDYQAEHGCERTVAMSAIRKRNPGAFSRFQNV